MKKTIQTSVLVLLIVLNLAFIFGNSMQKAESSNKISETISEKVVSTVTENKTKEDSSEPKTELQIYVENANRKNKEQKLNMILRQSFHAVEFFPLGLLLTLLAATHIRTKNKVPSSILCGFFALVFFAMSDEIIQIFVEGRSFETGDILVDCVGGFVGILVAGMIITALHRNALKRYEFTV